MEASVERFAINKSNFFTITTFMFNGELYANLRSLNVNVEGNTYKYGKNEDNELYDIIHNFLMYQENIDHINYISLHINEEKWFNTLFKKDFEKSNTEIDAWIHASEIKLVLPNKKGQYDPEELLNSLCCIEREEYELDDFNSLQVPPIYKFFGDKKNSSSCHCVHFDIVVYILMKRFPCIRSDLTRLLTVELEIANITNQTIEEVTKTRLTQLEIENERLRGENINLLAEIREVRRQNEQVITQNNQLLERTQGLETQNNQLLEDNRHTHQQLHQANHKLDSLGHQITGLADSFTSNFSEMNVTTGTAEYTYILLTRQSLTNDARRNGKIAADFSIFDSICCLKKDRQKQLLAHNFNPDTDVIEFEFECSSSLDMYKFISTNFSKLYCKYINSGEYRRKIAYVTNRKEQIIDKIRQYIERGSQNRFSIIERLDRLQDTVNNIETRVASIEDFFMYLRHKGTFIIDGKTIRRVLNRDAYHNLYINLDGSRHTLTLDELNNATFE